MMPQPLLLPTGSLLLSPCAGLPRRQPARRPSFQSAYAVCAPARVRSLPQSPGTGGAVQERPPRQSHPLHLVRKAMLRPSSSLRGLDEGRGNAVSKLLRNPTAAVCANPELPNETPLSLDRLTDIGWAFAYPLARVAPESNHPRTRPMNESWIAGESQRQSGRAARQTTSALRSPRILCSSSSRNRW